MFPPRISFRHGMWIVDTISKRMRKCNKQQQQLQQQDVDYTKTKLLRVGFKIDIIRFWHLMNNMRYLAVSRRSDGDLT